MNWRLGEGSRAWRWALLPALRARLLRDKDLERQLMARDQDPEWERDLLAHVFARASEIAACFNHPDVPDALLARRHDILDMLDHADTSHMLEPESYGNEGRLRLALQQTLGLGLGAFDLVITDEAHKSRGETSGLSTLLERVVVANRHRRRVSMTATPSNWIRNSGARPCGGSVSAPTRCARGTAVTSSPAISTHPSACATCRTA
jgi:hypothetical protein